MRGLLLLGLLLSAPVAFAAFIPTYDIVSFMPGVPTDGAIIRIAMVRKVQLVAGLPNTKCIAKTAAAGSTTVTLNQISGGVTTAIGTLVWSAAGTVCAVTFATTRNFAIGDVLEELYPTPADATLADIAISLPGIRQQ